MGADKEKEILKRLPGDIRRVAELIGIEPALKLAMAFKGTYLYFGGINSLERELRDLRVRRDFDSGFSTKNLALKYKISERHIKTILSNTEKYPDGLLRLLDGL
ncbi:MAG: hypothetical protein HY805_11190 [Nitrospirae bacterium]|nr:hypothetical protein [Nitrospirota bacterium]